MKIFFFRKKPLIKFKVNVLGRILVISLTVCLISSQLVNLKTTQTKSVSVQSVADTVGEIAVFTSHLGQDEEVWILVDGEKRERIKDNCARVILNSSSAIEIMSESEKEFTVNLLHADNIVIAGEVQNVKCRKGINYICRCIVA